MDSQIMEETWQQEDLKLELYSFIIDNKIIMLSETTVTGYIDDI